MGMEEQTCLHSEPAGKGRERKKKTPDINPGQRHLKYTNVGSTIENVEVGSAIEWISRIITSQTDRPTQLI
jgi:hypothetical protein